MTTTQNGNGRGDRDGWWAGLGRYLRYKLVVPMKRSPHPPGYTAKGVAVGVFIGMTPLVGIQMYLSTMAWLACRWHPKTDFQLLQAILWVWISNVFTMVPMYYGFYVTGQAMLGRFDDISGYEAFAELFKFSKWQGDTFWHTMENYFIYVADKFGLPLGIGWIPYGVVFGWIAYKVTLKLLVERRERLRRRWEDEAARRNSDNAG